MNTEKKISYLKRHIENLNLRIKELNEENQSLIESANSKESYYQKWDSTLKEREDHIKEMEESFTDLITELNEIKTKYKQALSSVSDIHIKYEEEIKKEIKRLRRSS